MKRYSGMAARQRDFHRMAGAGSGSVTVLSQKPPCRECGEIVFHATQCQIDKGRPFRVTRWVADDEREGAQ